MRKISFIAVLAAILTFLPCRVYAAPIDPQYLFLRKDPMNCNPSDCRFLWNMDNPATITKEALHDIIDQVGRGNSANTRKVGVGVVFNYWIGDFEKNKQSLDALLRLSQQEQIPVFLVFDGVNWWDKRPDLWNWWDPNITPQEREKRLGNVEWTCWESSCAIKKAWRNWGAEFEVKPAPNLASPAVIQATKNALRDLIPTVVDWYQNTLSEDQKYLFGGISFATEVDIGANYYYYPGGTNNGKGLVGSVQLGYAAVKTSGIKSSGTLAPDDINQVVARYQSALNKTAYDLGIPRNKIFNHNGGKGAAPFISYPPGVAFESLAGSLNEYAQPGWSFYGDVTANPQKYPDLVNVLNAVGNTPWSSPEWLTFASDYNGWVASLRGSLNFRNNRFINVANWEAIRDKPYVVSAIKTVAAENPTCWVTTPSVTVTTTGNSATLTWQKGATTEATYLNVSTNGQHTPAGLLQSVDTVNDNVSAKSSYTIPNLGNKTYYWILTADGCGQRKIAGGSFQIYSSDSPAESVTSPPVAKATSTPTNTPVQASTTLVPGDVNGDNHVNADDFNLMVARFTAKYSIYDYNNLVENYGK